MPALSSRSPLKRVIHGRHVRTAGGLGAPLTAATRVGHDDEPPTRNLAMELVRTTEAAALAASNWVGRGDKEGADGAAVDAMRLILGTVSMTGTVIIGEGEKDEAPMLFNGEVVGDGSPTLRRHRGRSDRRHDADVQGPRRRRRRHRGVRVGHDVRSRARACTWRRLPSAPRPRTPSTSMPPSATTSAPWPRPQGNRSSRRSPP